MRIVQEDSDTDSGYMAGDGAKWTFIVGGRKKMAVFTAHNVAERMSG